jgi:hypothetical protein
MTRCGAKKDCARAITLPEEEWPRPVAVPNAGDLWLVLSAILGSHDRARLP